MGPARAGTKEGRRVKNQVSIQSVKTHYIWRARPPRPLPWQTAHIIQPTCIITGFALLSACATLVTPPPITPRSDSGAATEDPLLASTQYSPHI